MKKLFILFLCPVVAHCQFDDRIKSVTRKDAPPLDINTVFGAFSWQLRIHDPRLKRIDLKFMLGEKELIKTWLIDDEGKEDERLLDIAVGPIENIGIPNKWRIFAGIHGRSSHWAMTIDRPEGFDYEHWSISGGPVLQDDGSFGLVFYSLSTPDGKKDIPLKVFIHISDSE